MMYPPMGHPSQMSGPMQGQMQPPQMQPPQMQQGQMNQGPRTQNQMPPGTMQQSPTVISRGPRPANEGVGPTVTVFVGNITDRAPDNMMRQVLQHCGSVVSWKRVQGASGVLQGMFNILQKFLINLHLKSKYVNWSSLKICLAFGFCEYSNPDAALRSIRLLHELEIGEKNLVVKVYAKTKLILDTYKGKIVFQYILKNFINLLYVLSADKIKAAGGGSTNGDDEFLTQEQRVQDKWVKERIGQTLKDYESEMQANQARGNIDFNEFNVLINVVTWISISLQPRKRKEENKKKKKPEQPKRKRPTAWI